LKGVNGIGEKTTAKLLSQFGTLENIYDNFDKLSDVHKEKFLSSKEQALMCKKISTIYINVLNSFNMDDFIFNGINKTNLLKFVHYYNFIGFDKYL
jgi:DNA polymerase-1